jgi:hypothetical protein
VLGGLVEGFEKLRWQRHTYPGNSLVIQYQFKINLTVLLNLVVSAKSITSLRLYITT